MVHLVLVNTDPIDCVAEPWSGRDSKSLMELVVQLDGGLDECVSVPAGQGG